MSKIKYYNEFSDIVNNRYRVEITDDEYNGPMKEMELGPEAVTLSRPTKKITDSLFSMGVTIQAFCNQNFEYEGLFTTREQVNQVIVYRNGNVIFRGWIEPNMYEEEFIVPPYCISIPASDGLSALENYYPSELKGIGLISLLDVIKACLDCTGLRLPINVACSLNPDNKTDNRLFEHCYVEKEALRKYKDGVYEYDNARQLLEDVLLSFSCRCYQASDEWFIERIKDRTTQSVEWIRYATDGTSKSVLKEDAISLDTPQYMFVNSPATLQVDSGYGKQTVKADGSKWETVVANNFADGFTVMTDLTYPNYPFGADHRVWYKRGSGTSVSAYSDVEFAQGARIQHTPQTSESDRIWQRAQITANKEDEINISFKITIEPGRYEAYKGDYQIGIQSYLRQRNDIFLLSLKWDKDQADQTIYINGIGTDYLSYGQYNKDNDWKDGFSIPVDISITGKLEHLHESFDLDELSFAVLPVRARTGKKSWSSSSDYVRATIVGDIKVSVNEKRQYDNTFTATINRKYLREADSIDIRFWTLPSKYQYKDASNYNFKNGLFNADNGGIHSISCPGENIKPLSVSERLLVDNFDQYYDPRNLLSGEVMTPHYISPEQHIRVATRPAKAFLLVGLDASLREAVFEINIEEIKPHQISIG